MNWTLEQLRAFVTAAEKGSFSAAGRTLGRAQSVVSTHISMLEDSLGVELFDRSSRSPVLTAAGRDLLPEANAVLRQSEQIPGESYTPGQLLRVYVLEARQGPKSTNVYVSRTHPNVVRRLFELETPEIADGQVEIRNIAREAGSRSKIAVRAAVEIVGLFVLGQLNGFSIQRKAGTADTVGIAAHSCTKVGGAIQISVGIVKAKHHILRLHIQPHQGGTEIRNLRCQAPTRYGI